ncbi:MAG: hypothetical protein NVS4B12_19610 [Ktedonobacteraceae bacterium]
MQERQRIAHMIGVNNVTLMRWATNRSNPRIEGLRRFLQAVPSHRQQLLELIPEEFPEFSLEKTTTEVTQEIPSAFYERVLQAYTSNPPLLRASSIRITIIQQILGHLDPVSAGLAVSISVCVPPTRNGNVYSLREAMGRGTSPWHSHLGNRMVFLGIESPQGYAVAEGRPVVMRSHEEKAIQFPSHVVEWEESAMAYPLLLADRVAGCLYISSPQQEYFSQTLQDLLKSYASLLTLGFEQHDFYKIGQIVLGIMPPFEMQQTYLRHFQQRVSHYMRDMQSSNPVPRIEAELKILQDIEQELLLFPYGT